MKTTPRGLAAEFLKAELAAKHRQPCPICGPKVLTLEVPGLGSRTVPVTCGHQDAAWTELKALDDRQATYQTRLAKYGQVMPPATYSGLLLSDVLETPGNRRGLEAGRQFVAQWPRLHAEGAGLMFAGPPGTRKTLIASAIANEVSALHYLPVVITVTDLLDELRGRSAPPEFGTMLRRADLLVLDEFGGEKVTEFAAAELSAVIDARYRAKRPTIVTTNLGLGAVRAHWIRSLQREGMGADLASLAIGRILSRLSERCEAVEFSGEDGRAAARRSWLNVEVQS